MSDELTKLRARVAKLERERREAVLILRTECRDLGGSNDWPDEMHLADVIEKRLCDQVSDRIKELEATIAEYQATEQRLRDRIDQLYDEMGTQDDERGYE